MRKTRYCRIEFYVPADHLEAVKDAMFTAGAGRLGDYDRCAWQTLGQGQYRPCAGANPHLGQVGRLETVAEYKVEMVCETAKAAAVVVAMKAAHPYEEVAYALLATDGGES